MLHHLAVQPPWMSRVLGPNRFQVGHVGQALPNGGLQSRSRGRGVRSRGGSGGWGGAVADGVAEALVGGWWWHSQASGESQALPQTVGRNLYPA